MSGDLSVSAAAPVQTASLVRAAPSNSSTATTAGTTTATTALSSGLKGPPPVNPGLYLDPATNLVVLQFFDAKGDVVQSSPSQKQLDAYRINGGPPKDGTSIS